MNYLDENRKNKVLPTPEAKVSDHRSTDATAREKNRRLIDDMMMMIDDCTGNKKV